MRLELMEYVNENLPQGFLPYYIYSMMIDEQEVGRIVLREGNDDERYLDGHIGYSVFEEFRGHNYAYEACLELKRIVNREYLFITCDPQNQASLQIIKKLGCIYLETKTIPSSRKRFFTSAEKEKMIFKWVITH